MRLTNSLVLSDAGGRSNRTLLPMHYAPQFGLMPAVGGEGVFAIASAMQMRCNGPSVDVWGVEWTT